MILQLFINSFSTNKDLQIKRKTTKLVAADKINIWPMSYNISRQVGMVKVSSISFLMYS